MICDNDRIETTVYRKPTNSEIYLNWKSYLPCSWKCGTLKTIIRRAYLIFSTPDYLHLLLFPYSGPKCQKPIRSMKNDALKSKLPYKTLSISQHIRP